MSSAAFAIREMLRRLHAQLDRVQARRRWPASKTASSGPHAFAVHRHPGGAFEVRHPADWTAVDDAGGTLVRPSRLNAFGRIDVVPEGRRRWTALERWVRRCGGRTDVLGERDAVVELGPTRFACIASVRRGPGLRLVLVSGIAVRPALSPALSAYLSGVLRAVRRHTRIGN